MGCGVAVSLGCTSNDPALASTVVGTALAFGLAVVAMAYTIGGISGCHINPAITLGVWASGRMNAKDAVLYMVFQVIGAIAGAAGGALSVAETVLLDNKPEFQRSGSCAGASGMIGVQTPFVIIERPRFSVPDKVQKYVGQTSNITLNLGDCTGFTAVEFVHLDGLNATSEEITEIESMLRSGVIF
jgi:hypothetical protein